MRGKSKRNSLLDNLYPSSEGAKREDYLKRHNPALQLPVETLELLYRDKSQKEIAEYLGTTPKKVAWALIKNKIRKAKK